MSEVQAMERDWLCETGDLVERMGTVPWGSTPLKPGETC
jgi:hypothetical protein